VNAFNVSNYYEQLDFYFEAAERGSVSLLIHVFPEIAASFAKASHFNTFGGSPLACAVASSVLDVRTDLVFLY